MTNAVENRLVATSVRAPRWAVQRVASALHSDPGQSTAAIARKTGLSPNFVRACLGALDAERSDSQA